jgi:hypothetical protein
MCGEGHRAFCEEQCGTSASLCGRGVGKVGGEESTCGQQVAEIIESRYSSGRGLDLSGEPCVYTRRIRDDEREQVTNEPDPAGES